MVVGPIYMPLLHVVLLEVYHPPCNSIRSDGTPVEECQRFIVGIEYYFVSVDVNPELFQGKYDSKQLLLTRCVALFCWS